MTANPWPKRPWPDAVPLYATRRNPDRATLGPEVAAVARRLGFEPMPWNLDYWDTRYEYTIVDDPRWGEVKRLWYREARLTVPRQSSKTTATFIEQVDRMLNGVDRGWGDRPVAGFTMQHASDARDKMVEEWMPILRAHGEFSPDLDLPTSTHFTLSNGKEAIRWPGEGRMITFPPNATGAHGSVLDHVDIDEAFAHPDNRAEKGSRPAMITRPSPCINVKSTAGDSTSTYLLGKVEDGRARVDSGIDSHVMFTEFACNREAGQDPHNPEHWPLFMPALGYTQSLEALLIEHDTMVGEPGGAEEWERAFGNLWVATAVRVIPAKAWAACRDPEARIVGRHWLAVDASPYPSTWGSISVAGYTEDGRILTELIEHRPGVDWMAEALRELTRARVFHGLLVDPKGPINSVIPDIERVALAKIEAIEAEAMTAACGRYLDGIVNATVRHLGQQALDAAVEGAARRQLLDSWAFARRTSTADISPLVSCVLAHWAAAKNPTRGLIGMG